MDRDTESAIADLRFVLCRRLGHEWGEWRTFGHPEDAKRTHEARWCKTCAAQERKPENRPVVKQENP